MKPNGMNRWYLVFCVSSIVHCKSFHTNQHLPLQSFQPPLRYYQPPYPNFISAETPSKSGYPSETPQPGDYSDLLRQYQQWQIDAQNHNGGVVWISAPIYNGQSPQNVPPYPPAPPSSLSPPGTPSNPHPSGSSANQNGIVRDTEIAPGSFETSTLSTTTVTSSTPATTSESNTSSLSPSTIVPSSNTNETVTETTALPSNGTTQSSSNNSLSKYCREPRGQFPDPSDCNKFINCWDGTAFEQTCPSGLVFNAEKKYCDYPENVNCSNSNATHPNSTSSPPTSNENSTTNSKCPSYYGTHRNASNCAAFYVCVYGEPVDFVCPSGTFYNDNLGVCDYEDRVDCKGAPSTAAPTTAPSPSETTTIEPNTTSTADTEAPSMITTSANSTEAWSPSSNKPPLTTTSEPPTTGSSTKPIQPESAGSPPPVDPIGLYNFNLKKLPESIVNTGVRCYHQNALFRLTPDCSSVTICNDGLTYIVNCGQATSFDTHSQRCVPTFRAAC